MEFNIAYETVGDRSTRPQADIAMQRCRKAATKAGHNLLFSLCGESETAHVVKVKKQTRCSQ